MSIVTPDADSSKTDFFTLDENLILLTMFYLVQVASELFQSLSGYLSLECEKFHLLKLREGRKRRVLCKYDKSYDESCFDQSHTLTKYIIIQTKNTHYLGLIIDDVLPGSSGVSEWLLGLGVWGDLGFQVSFLKANRQKTK